jgi:hypothetical protein
MIQHIVRGDIVYDKSGREVPVLHNCKFLVPTEELVLISKDAIAPDMPERDTMVTPGHPVVINGNEIVSGDLINGTTIRMHRLDKPVQVYTLCTSERVTFMGSGLEIVTYQLDDFLEHARKHNVLYQFS